MVGYFSGVVQSPLTAFVIVMEMTDDHAMLVPLMATALVALPIGALSLRTRGIYFIMTTLAFAQIAWSVAFQWVEVTGGDNGLLGIWPARLEPSKLTK